MCKKVFTWEQLVVMAVDGNYRNAPILRVEVQMCSSKAKQNAYRSMHMQVR